MFFFKLISGGKKERIICCSMKSPWWGTRRQDLRSALWPRVLCPGQVTQAPWRALSVKWKGWTTWFLSSFRLHQSLSMRILVLRPKPLELKCTKTGKENQAKGYWRPGKGKSENDFRNNFIQLALQLKLLIITALMAIAIVMPPTFLHSVSHPPRPFTSNLLFSTFQRLLPHLPAGWRPGFLLHQEAKGIESGLP